jgi:putative transposase
MKRELSVERRASSPVGTLACYCYEMHQKYEYRRRLPHYQPDDKIFFITFCTHRRWKLPPRARDIVLQTCRRGDGLLFELLGVVVMPDHVHLALVPLSGSEGTVSLPRIMQAIKGSSAHAINKDLGLHGPVWQQESFDRALRREEQFQEKLDYMIGNPVRAGLVRDPLAYPWLWRKTGGVGDDLFEA